MTPAAEKLFALLKERSFKFGQFKLASGDTSTYFIDGKMSMIHSAGAYLIGQVLFEHTQELTIDAIGGLAAGAIPLATAAVIGYHLNGRAMEGFWVRNEVKDHGTKKLVEGNVRPGSRVVVLEDVVTRGQSAMKAIDAVRELGCEVVRVVTLVDRLQGGEQLFRDKGVTDYRAVFTIRDFGVEV